MRKSRGYEILLKIIYFQDRVGDTLHVRVRVYVCRFFYKSDFTELMIPHSQHRADNIEKKLLNIVTMALCRFLR